MNAIRFIRQFQRPTQAFGAIYQRCVTTEKAWTCVKIGATILVNDVPHSVIKAVQGGRGRGGSWVKSTIKNLFSGKTLDKTFGSEDMLETPEVIRTPVEYSWNDDASKEFVFMDPKSFEEVRVPHHVLNKPQFLQQGQMLLLTKYKEAIIDLEFPHMSEYILVSIDETKQMGKLVAGTLDTGAVVGVPTSIKVGSKIKVNITSEEFHSRV